MQPFEVEHPDANPNGKPLTADEAGNYEQSEHASCLPCQARTLQPLDWDEEHLLIFGYFLLTPRALFRFLLWAYVSVYAVYTVADVMSLVHCAVEASDSSKNAAASFETSLRWCSLIRRTLVFIAFLIILKLGVHIKLNVGQTWIEDQAWAPCCTSCGLVCRETIYLTVFVLGFLLISIPFVFLRNGIFVDANFVNTFEAPAHNHAWEALKARGLILYDLENICDLRDVFMIVLSLLFLKCRFGWLIMCVLVCVGSVLLNAGPDTFEQIFPLLAKSMGMDPVGFEFPKNEFIVTEDFPPLHNSTSCTFGKDWMSANRIWYKVADVQKPSNAVDAYETNDNKRGNLKLTRTAEGVWSISEDGYVYADSNQEGTLWFVNGKEAPSAHAVVRDGARLTQMLVDQSMKLKISISKVVMQRMSHIEWFQNAAYMGLGGGRALVQLRDTLFFAHTGSAAEVGNLCLRYPEPLWPAPHMKSMTDESIVAVIGHEMGHAALGHVVKGLLWNLLTFWLHFGLLAWTTQNPLFSAALSFPKPRVYSGIFAYSFMVNPLLSELLRTMSCCIIRGMEYQADEFSAKLSKKNAQGMRDSLRTIGENSLDIFYPPWLYQFLNLNHPSIGRRMDRLTQITADLYK